MSAFRFHPAARREVTAAAERYARVSRRAARRFRVAVEEAVRAATALPLAGSPYLHGTRRRILTRFPFSLVYLGRTRLLWIVAVAHHRRRPGYWAGRLPRG